MSVTGIFRFTAACVVYDWDEESRHFLSLGISKRSVVLRSVKWRSIDKVD